MVENSYDDDRHFQRLSEQVQYDYREQRPDREIHQLIISHLVGEYYPMRLGQKGIETSINLLSLALRGMSRQLVSRAPRIMVTAQDQRDNYWAEDAELAANKRIRRSDLASVVRDVVDQSMVSLGVFFMGVEPVGDRHDMPMRLVMRSIDRADFVYDRESTRLEMSDIQGHKFRMPLQDVRDHPLFNENRFRVDADARDVPDDEHTNVQGRKSAIGEQLYDYADIWCIYERRRGQMWYFPVNQPTLPLLQMEWRGPRSGPYRYLWYEKPPNHALPISPAMHLLKKHRAFNTLDVKSIHQQATAKGNLYFTSASKAEAERIVKSLDNDSVLRESGAAHWGHIGGTHPGTVSMAEKQRADFSYQAGNMDSYSGLGSQADTLGQERLLRGAANEMLEDMGGYSYDFMKGVCEDIFWYEVRDPNPTSTKLTKPVEGADDVFYVSEWSREKRQMVAEREFDVDVEPYSYRQRSPESRLADLLGSVQFYMAIKEDATAQGLSMDVEKLLKLIARRRDLPEFNDLMIYNQEPRELAELAGGRGDRQEGGSGDTKRYVRESVSDGSGERQAMIQALSQGLDADGVAA